MKTSQISHLQTNLEHKTILLLVQKYHATYHKDPQTSLQ